MGLMMLGMVLFWGLLIFLAIWLVKLLFQTGTPHDAAHLHPPTASEILDERYRRGEITQEQYRQMQKDLAE
jgi:putative membrane protein